MKVVEFIVSVLLFLACLFLAGNAYQAGATWGFVAGLAGAALVLCWNARPRPRGGSH